VKAGNLYKAGKAYDKAGASFLNAAECQGKVPDMGLEVAASLTKAAGCFKKGDFKAFVDCLARAVATYLSAGQTSTAAKTQQEVAEAYDEHGDINDAFTAYEAAADMFEQQMVASSTNHCRYKMADISCIRGEYVQASQLYEMNARACVEANPKSRVIPQLTAALVCRLASGDALTCKRNFDSFASIDTGAFRDSKELAMCRAVCAAMDVEGDGPSVSDVCLEHDAVVSRLPPHIRTALNAACEQAKAVADKDGLL